MKTRTLQHAPIFLGACVSYTVGVFVCVCAPLSLGDIFACVLSFSSYFMDHKY